MESGAIKNWQLTASSQNKKISGPENARLNLEFKKKKNAGAWLADEEDYSAWLQVDLNNAYTLITGIATQGKGDKKIKRVTKYKLQYWGAGVEVKFYKEHGQSGAFKVSESTTPYTLPRLF